MASASTLEVSVIVDLEEDATDVVFKYAGNILSEQLNIETEIVYIDTDPDLPEHTHAPALMDSLFTYRTENVGLFYSDVMVLLTSRDLKNGTRDLVGYARIGAICSGMSIVIVEITNNGLDGQTLAHEIAHNLGAVHDGDTPCEDTPRGYLMSSAIHNGSDYLSQCSIDTINAHIEIFGGCLSEANVPPVVVDPPIIDIPTRGGGGSMNILFILFLLTLIWRRDRVVMCESAKLVYAGSNPAVASNGDCHVAQRYRKDRI